MTYTDFRTVWASALNYTADQRGLYIAEHNTQNWTDEFGDDTAAIICTLNCIYDIAHGGIKAIRAVTGLSQQAFGDAYGIPRRSIQNWECGSNSAPAYTVMHLGFAVVADAIPRLMTDD